MTDSVTSLHPMYPYSEHLPCRCGLFRRRGLRFIELHLWLNLSLIHLFISLNWYWARWTACANEFLQIGAMRQTAQIKAHNSVKKTRKTHDDAGIYHALACQKSVRILTIFLQVWQLFFLCFGAILHCLSFKLWFNFICISGSQQGSESWYVFSRRVIVKYRDKIRIKANLIPLET